MPNSLFTATLADIEYDDVVAFCNEQLPESVNLDYKRDMPAGEKLAKTISSFANTFGGIVVIGVDEDDQSRPRVPSDGLAFEPKLEERVWSVVTDHIYPPVLPEVRVCPPVNDRTFVVVRVPQSATTPHAVRHNTSVYLRTGNITKPEALERLATVSEVEWLRDRRKKSEALRAEVVARMLGRMEALRRLNGVTAEKAKVDVCVGPKYPAGPLFSLAELAEFRRASLMYSDTFTNQNRAHEGFVSSYITPEDVETYVETNIFGFVFESTGLYAPNSDDEPGVVHLESVLDAMADTLRFASKIAKHRGFWGVWQIDVRLRGLEGSRLAPIGRRFSVSPSRQLDDVLQFTVDIPASAWRDDGELISRIGDVATAVVWSFGWTIDGSMVAAQLKESSAWRASG
jgi:hypothetical protein